MKKKLDTDQITNELKGHSLYFEDQSKRIENKNVVDGRPNKRTGKQANARTDEQPNERTDERTGERTSEQVNERTAEQPNERTHEQVTVEKRERNTVKRAITRHSYQFYADQVATMKSLWLSYLASGIEIDLSDFARAAFDEYLDRIKQKPDKSADVRTDERTND